MRILFLGTGAAEGIPAPFCECEVCRHARQAGGRDARMRTAVLINDDLLIDLGPDIVASTQRLGVSLSRVETLLVTHDHMDHWYPDNLMLRFHWFRATPVPPLHLFAPEPVTRLLSADAGWSERLAEVAVVAETVGPGQSWRAGAYRLTALPATHANGAGALLYCVDDGSKKLLYATDSGPFTEQAWSLVAREAPFDAVLMDETMGSWETWGEHQSFATFLQAHGRFATEGWMKAAAPFVAFHFSHQSNPSHAELARHFEPHGVLVAYDGLCLVI